MIDIEKFKIELTEDSPLKEEFLECNRNGICKCKVPLSLFAGPEREYCFRCKKIVK